MKNLQERYGKLVNTINYISIAIVFILMLMTTLDVFLRKTRTGLSVKGSYELTEMGMVVVVFLGIAALQMKNGHVHVDMFVRLFPARFRRFYMGTVMVIETFIGGVMTVGAYQKCQSLVEQAVVTSVLKVPHLPFAVFMVVGLALFTVAMALQATVLFAEGVAGDENSSLPVP